MTDLDFVPDADGENEELPFAHEADGCPTSEPCEGIRECADCQDVLTQVAESLDPGDHLGVLGGGLGHVLRVNEDHTFHVIDPNDYHPIAAKILDGTEGVMG